LKTSGVLHGIYSPQMGMSEGVMSSRLAQPVANRHTGGDLCDDGTGTLTISNGTRAGINPRAAPLNAPQASGAAQGGVGLHVGVGLSDDGPCELLTSELMQAPAAPSPPHSAVLPRRSNRIRDSAMKTTTPESKDANPWVS
jgi:hypothetical protein